MRPRTRRTTGKAVWQKYCDNVSRGPEALLLPTFILTRPAPEGQTRIARRFIAGNLACSIDTSPVVTTEGPHALSRPYETCGLSERGDPGDKSPGYSQMSLRDIARPSAGCRGTWAIAWLEAPAPPTRGGATPEPQALACANSRRQPKVTAIRDIARALSPWLARES